MSSLRLLLGPLMQQVAGDLVLPVTSGLVIHLDASALELTDEDSVETWPDLSGNGNDFESVDVSPIIDPTYIEDGIGGLPAVEWRSVGAGLIGPSSAGTGLTAIEVFLVLKAFYENGSGHYRGHPLQWTGSASTSHYTFSDGHIYEGLGTTVRKDTGNPTNGIMQTDHLYNVRSASGAFSTHLNGSSFYSTASNTVGLGYIGPQLGYYDNSTHYYRGRIAEVIVYNRVLSTGERDSVHDYIATKYGITIA